MMHFNNPTTLFGSRGAIGRDHEQSAYQLREVCDCADCVKGPVPHAEPRIQSRGIRQRAQFGLQGRGTEQRQRILLQEVRDRLQISSTITKSYRVRASLRGGRCWSNVPEKRDHLNNDE